MFNFTNTVPTTKKNAGKNACKYIVLHHTGGGSYASNLRILSGDTGEVSVQFIVGPNGESAKIGNPTDILRHAGESKRGKDVGLNSYAMGIEIVGPDKNGRFSDKQFNKVIELVRYLQGVFNISKENVLCHHDITWNGSKDMLLRDGKSSCRKPDLSRMFRAERGFKSFKEFRDGKLL